jgi:DNA invertase Pin-like site-specific DNA recombinase
MNAEKILQYKRVSSKSQNKGRQLEAMKEKGIEDRDIFMDKQSGKDFNRAQYQFKRILKKRFYKSGMI